MIRRLKMVAGLSSKARDSPRIGFSLRSTLDDVVALMVESC